MCVCRSRFTTTTITHPITSHHITSQDSGGGRDGQTLSSEPASRPPLGDGGGSKGSRSSGWKSIRSFSKPEGGTVKGDVNVRAYNIHNTYMYEYRYICVYVGNI